jgi:hypothetical protein
MDEDIWIKEEGNCEWAELRNENEVREF